MNQATVSARRVYLAYPARAWDGAEYAYNDSVSQGNNNLRGLLESYTQRCPGDQRYVLIGYSQGAHVIGNVLESGLSARTKARIAAAVLFGDPAYRAGEPYNYQQPVYEPLNLPRSGNFARNPGSLSEFNSRIRSYCVKWDKFCQNNLLGGATAENAHASYKAPNVQQHATNWILGKLYRPPAIPRDHVSDFSGDGAADVLGVNSAGNLLYYPNNRQRLSTSTQIGNGWASFRHVMAADWSGDGIADVLGVDAAGNLWYYPNNRQTLSAPTQIGNGWASFRHVMAADWSGDGVADVLGVDANGNLWYYPHNGAGLSTPNQIGNGWGSFRHVMAADWSGDGVADVLGVDANGNLWYYPHNGAGLSTPTQIGNGWGSFRHVMASDFSGDGAADILGVDANGNLWYYPHNGAGLSTPTQIGNGWGSFVHVM